MAETEDFKLTKGQKRALLHIRRGKDVFITGGAGTGKSAVVRVAVEEMEKQGKHVIKCAPTGIAALNIHGVTIHHAFGFPAEICINSGGSKRGSTLRTRTTPVLNAADVIIIDEVSMDRMDLFDAVIQSIEKIEKANGKHIQLIIVGDFFQLPPVLNDRSGDRAILEQFYHKDVGNAFAFQGRTWNKRKLYSIELTEIVRQADEELIENLNKLRIGDASCMLYFNQFVTAAEPNAISLYAYTADVDKANAEALQKLPGEEITFETQITYRNGFSPLSMDPLVASSIPQKLVLKEGARVVITANDYYGKHSEDISFLLYKDRRWKDEPLIANGMFATVQSVSFDENGQPSVFLNTDAGRIIEVFPVTYPVYDYTLDDDGVPQQTLVAEYSQLPMKLAYAVTIHRSQGQTYPAANLNPKSFAHGQLYVALTRIKDPSGIHLLWKMTKADIKTDPEVIEFYKNLNAPGKRTGRPSLNDNGLTRSRYLWIPKPLEKHVRTEIEKGHPLKMQTVPKYSGDRVHIRVSEDMYEHIKQEVAAWKKAAKKAKQS